MQYYERILSLNPEYEYKGVFVDRGMTGTTENRPQFQEMLELARAKEVDVIFTKPISRFARNTTIILEIIRELKELGVEVKFEKENLSSLSKDGELMLSVLSSFAQEESKSVSENLKWRIRKKFEQGELSINTIRFLGYDKDTYGDLVINHKEAKVVRMIFEEYLNGKGVDKIAKEFNMKNIKTVTGAKWRGCSVLGILKNEKYKGDALLQKYYTVDHLSKKMKRNTGEVDSFYIEEHYSPIVSKEMWDRVQEEIQRRAKAKGNIVGEREKYKKRYPLTRMLYCSKCEATLMRRTWNSRYTCKKIVWQCGNYVKNGKDSCSGTRIDEDIVNRLNIKEETIVKEEMKGGKKHYLYTRRDNQTGEDQENLQNPKKKMAAYCRVSTDQEEQLSSYQAQVNYYTTFIESHPDYEFAGIYADEGISGTNTKKREQFNKMIQDCKAGKIDMIITKSISRFARNTLDCLQYVRLLKEHGVGVWFEKENIDTLDSKGEVLLTILSSLAQEESNAISASTTWGIRRRFEQGEVTVNHTKFLGYDKDEEGNLIINKEQAKIVKRIYAEYLNGKGPTRIAKELERDKIKGVTGTTKWYTSTIDKMLQNEKFKGDALLQKSYTKDFLNKVRVKNEGEITQYYVQESHPAIIEPEIWEAVQLESKRRKKYVEVHRLQKYDYGLEDTPFTGRVICGECGSAFGRRVWHSNTKPKRVWQCGSKYQEKGEQGCKSQHIYDDTLENAFIAAVNALIENKEHFLQKWKEQLQEENFLKRVVAKRFIREFEHAEKVKDFDVDLFFRIIEKFVIESKQRVKVCLLDGTEIEVEIE